MADPVELPGSHRDPVAGSRVVGPVNPEEKIRVTLVISPDVDFDHYATGGALAAALPSELVIVSAHPESRTIQVEGSASILQKAFGATLFHAETPDGTYRSRTNPLTVPKALDGVILAALGLDNRPQARPHFRVRNPFDFNFGNLAMEPHAGVTYTPKQACAAYGLSPLSGPSAPQTIAIISLGGGYKPSDINGYFQAQGLPLPNVKVVSVDGANNTPGSDADGENILDIQVSGAIYSILTGQPANIVIYFAPNTDAGFLNAFNAAIHDQVNKPSVISCSWGSAESSWTQQAMTAYNAAFQGAAPAISMYAASGDNGSNDGVGGSSKNVDFPASGPSMTGCGGTTKTSASEVVWGNGNNGATGGGVSTFFGRPTYQSGLSLAGRGVPDVAGIADPNTGWVVRLNGQDIVIGGTSAVAPMWAGITAAANAFRVGAGKAPAGNVNALLYLTPSVLRDIVSGSNGAYSAGPGWDACTGLGVPSSALLGALMGGAVVQPPPPPPPVPTQPTPEFTFTLAQYKPPGTLLRLPVGLSPATHGVFRLPLVLAAASEAVEILEADRNAPD